MERSTHTLAVKSQRWIIEAALKLMEQRPYRDITVSQICQCAQVDRRTFYRNFRDKDDVLEYCVACLQEEYAAHLRAVEGRTIRSMARAQFEFWQGHLAVLRVLQANGFLTGILLKAADEFIPALYQSFHTDLPPNFEYKAAFVSGGFCNMLLRWIARGARESPDEMAEVVCELFDADNPYWRGYVQK